MRVMSVQKCVVHTSRSSCGELNGVVRTRSMKKAKVMTILSSSWLYVPPRSSVDTPVSRNLRVISITLHALG